MDGNRRAGSPMPPLNLEISDVEPLIYRICRQPVDGLRSALGVGLPAYAPPIGLEEAALHFFAALASVPGIRTFSGSSKGNRSMSGITEGAGPALAAHSKDASTPGHSPASEAMGKASPLSEGGEAAQRLLQQAEGFVRGQPLVSMAVFIAVGVVASKLLNRR